MAVTVILMDGSTTDTNPVPGRTCKEHLIEDGIVGGGTPDDGWQVNDSDGNIIDNDPIENYDGMKITVVKPKIPGGTG